MKRFVLIGALLLGWSSMVQAQQGNAEPYREGYHYFKLNQASAPRKSEVVTVTELFSYACHACNDFEPYMQNWKGRQAEDVKLNRIPVGFGRRAWEILARGYVIAEIMGVEEEAHVPLMNAIWKEQRQFRSIEDMADFYAEQGADKAKYMSLDNSFMLSMREKQNADKMGLYSIKGTPSMIVNGKYKIQTGNAVPNYQAMLSVVDFLVAKERVNLAPVAEAASEEAQEVETASN